MFKKSETFLKDIVLKKFESIKAALKSEVTEIISQVQRDRAELKEATRRLQRKVEEFTSEQNGLYRTHLDTVEADIKFCQENRRIVIALSIRQTTALEDIARALAPKKLKKLKVK